MDSQPPQATYAVIPEGCHAAGTTVELRNSPGVLERYMKIPPMMVCPPHWGLSLGDGGLPPILFVDTEGMVIIVDKFLRKRVAQVLTVGKRLDALAYDDYTGILSWMIPVFGKQKTHKLLVLTKAANTRHLYDLGHNGQTILSWEIQGPDAHDRGYGLGPHPKIRLQAAKKCQDAGFSIRLGIDLVPTRGWKDSYQKLVGWVCDSGVTPERWTLSILSRTDMGQRVAMYRVVINIIRSWYTEPVIGLCKETNAVWAAITGLYSNQVLSDCCNCTL